MTIEKEGALPYYRRKSDQAWDMAGLARADHDDADAMRRIQEAREWDRKAAEAAYE